MTNSIAREPDPIELTPRQIDNYEVRPEFFPRAQVRRSDQGTIPRPKHERRGSTPANRNDEGCTWPLTRYRLNRSPRL